MVRQRQEKPLDWGLAVRAGPVPVALQQMGPAAGGGSDRGGKASHLGSGRQGQATTGGTAAAGPSGKQRRLP